MVETIGNKLQRARLEKKITLEDAAYATKINAARLSDIETDVYTNFPNIAYAKGFLQIYSNYLGVDAQPYLSAFEDANTFGLDDYQYLSDVPIAQFRAQRRTVSIGGGGGAGGSRQRRRRQRRLLAGAAALVFLALGLFVWNLVLSFQRLGNIEQLASRNNGGSSSSGAKASAAPAADAARAQQENAKPAPASGLENSARTAPSTSVLATTSESAKATGAAAPPSAIDREGALSTVSNSGGSSGAPAPHSGLPNTLSALPEDGSVTSALVPPLGGGGDSAVIAATTAPAPAAAAATPEPVVRTALPVVPAPRNSTANHATKTATAVRR